MTSSWHIINSGSRLRAFVLLSRYFDVPVHVTHLWYKDRSVAIYWYLDEFYISLPYIWIGDIYSCSYMYFGVRKRWTQTNETWSQKSEVLNRLKRVYMNRFYICLIYVRNSETELASDIVLCYRWVDLNYKKLAVENVKLVRAKRAYVRSHGMACGIMIADFCHSKLIHTI